MLLFLRRYAAIGCLVITLIFAAGVSRAQEDQSYLVKAAFIYKFTLFVEWPGAQAISRQTDIDVCIIGDSDLSYASGVFQKASSSKLAIELKQESGVSGAASHCHIVFIGRSETAKVSALIAELRGKPVLTVSDIGGFAAHGGMIEFTTVDNKVKLIANTRAAAAAGLRIDAQLLEVALKVIDR